MSAYRIVVCWHGALDNNLGTLHEIVDAATRDGVMSSVNDEACLEVVRSRHSARRGRSDGLRVRGFLMLRCMRKKLPETRKKRQVRAQPLSPSS